MARRGKDALEADARAIASRFDQLPDEQIVGIRVVSIIRDRSVASIWRDVNAGKFIEPDVRAGKAGWKVGRLRERVAA